MSDCDENMKFESDDALHVDEDSNPTPPESDEQSQEQDDLTRHYWKSSVCAYQAANDSAGRTDHSEDVMDLGNGGDFECYASTRIGGRKENQDTAAVKLTRKGLLLVVCDGMGGGPAGKRASFLAAHTISEFVANSSDADSPEQILKDALQLAHSVLKYDVAAFPNNYGMGTTAAVMLINGEQATICHVGDSRIYELRNGKMIFRTKDHSLVARRMELEGWTDEEARTSTESNIITQAVGHRDIDPEVDVCSFLKGDRFLICSDGIWGHYPQKDLMKILEAKKLSGALSDLMVTTDNIGIEEGNTHDNLTAILVQANINSKLKGKMTKFSKILVIVLGILLCVSIVLNIVQYNQKKDNSKAEKNIEMMDSSDAKTPPQVSVKSEANVTPETVELTENTAIKTDSLYVIREGDAISAIALRFKLKTEDIKRANPNMNIDKIKPGQTIKIPLKNIAQ